ncbi:MAG: hypothetical protein LBU69_00160 [Deltaproteobacteria bacterium]|jgi:chemotaxis methyl-accepting protein methylase|nr:hypothetical protein [Deltaproteobacteria bacterium]
MSVDSSEKKPIAVAGEKEPEAAETFPDPWDDALKGREKIDKREKLQPGQAKGRKRKPRAGRDSEGFWQGQELEFGDPGMPPWPAAPSEDPYEVELIRQAGLFFWRAASPRGQRRLLVEARSRRKKLGASPAEYLATLRRFPGEWDELWYQVDSGQESHFFRFPEQFALLTQLLEERATVSAERELRVLSVGCGLGHEACSLAMALRDSSLAVKGWKVTIRGIALSEKLARQAGKAVFTRQDIDWLRPEMARRWFEVRAAGWGFDMAQGADMGFYRFNLADLGSLPETPIEGPRMAQERLSGMKGGMAGVAPEELSQDETHPMGGPSREGLYDVMFCRGMTFDCPDSQVKLLAKAVSSMLGPGGLLFSAPGEIWPIGEGLALEERDGVVYGRKDDPRGRKKVNVFHVPRKKAKERKAIARRETGAPAQADPRRASLVGRFEEVIGHDPDAARDLVLETCDVDLENKVLDSGALSMMARVEEALGREERAKATREFVCAITAGDS